VCSRDGVAPMELAPMTRATDGCTARGGFVAPVGAATLGLKAPSGFLAWARARIERGVNSGMVSYRRVAGVGGSLTACRRWVGSFAASRSVFLVDGFSQTIRACAVGERGG